LSRLDHFAPQYDEWATRVAVEAVLDIASITARADVKNEILKELDRNISTIKRIADQPGVDPKALDRVLSDLSDAMAGVHRLTGPIGQIAREDDFLKSVAQRSSIPGGTCSFDLPHFHHWLTQPPEVRQARLDYWLKDLRPAEQAIRLVLSLARASASPRQVLAERRILPRGARRPGTRTDGSRRHQWHGISLSGDQRPQEPFQHPLHAARSSRSAVSDPGERPVQAHLLCLLNHVQHGAGCDCIGFDHH
jgi:hypothetical protein